MDKIRRSAHRVGPGLREIRTYTQLEFFELVLTPEALTDEDLAHDCSLIARALPRFDQVDALCLLCPAVVGARPARFVIFRPGVDALRAAPGAQVIVTGVCEVCNAKPDLLGRLLVHFRQHVDPGLRELHVGEGARP
jgi:hypothetical protein